MQPYVKDVIDGMEKGWVACPKQLFNKLLEGSPTEPIACCAVGHYLLGSTGEVKVDIQTIKSDAWSLLCRIVELNNEKGMTTPQIIELLRKENEYPPAQS